MWKLPLKANNLIIVIGLLVGTLVLPAAAQMFYPIYWVKGTVITSSEASINGRQVVLYDSAGNLQSGIYADDAVGAAGASGLAGQFMINSFGAISQFANVGSTYYVAIPKGGDGYGAAPVEVTLSGSGVDTLSAPLVLAYGAGPNAPLSNPPRISEIRFGTRLYQRDLVARGEEFIVSGTTKISAKIDSDTHIDAASVRISASNRSSGAAAQIYQLSADNVTAQTAEEGVIKNMSVSYEIPETSKLNEGENVISITAANTTASTTETCVVTVAGGPLRIIGPVIAYPAPFSFTKHGKMEIQYQLSRDASLDIYLISVSGQTVKRFTCQAGQEGGTAGYNKVVWDGTTDMGPKAGNAVYVGTVVSKEDGKMLAKFKMSIVD